MAHPNPPIIAPESRPTSGVTPPQHDLQNEINRLTQEVKRLSQLVIDQSEELDTYRKAAQAWAVAQVTEADIRRYVQDEPGLPLNAFIDELEQIHHYCNP